MNVCVSPPSSRQVLALKKISFSSDKRDESRAHSPRRCKLGVGKQACCSGPDSIAEGVAMISLYRGELHKVSNVPRQWTVPKSQIPVSVFRNALQKRNAAILREYESASPDFLANSGISFCNGTAQCSVVSPSGQLEELENQGMPDSNTCKVLVSVEEKRDATLAGKRAESSERIEEENDTWQERKRKKHEDTRDDSDTHTAKDDIEQRDPECQEFSTILKAKAPLECSESMAIDTAEQSEGMECDILAVEDTGVDCGENMFEQSRDRVSEPGTSVQLENTPCPLTGLNDSKEERLKVTPNIVKDGEQPNLDAPGTTPSSVEESRSAVIVNRTSTNLNKDGKEVGHAEVKVIENGARKRKRGELQAKLEKLTAEKHHLVLMLKQVLNEEETKKRVSTSTALQQAVPSVTGCSDPTVVVNHVEKVRGSNPCGDLEEGELEYARTPSPPPRPVQSNHSTLGPHNVLGHTPSMVPILGRQNTLTQHISQGSSGRGGYYVPGIGIPPTPVGPGIGGGGALSPGTVFMGNLPSPLGPHNYSHNMALQHAAAMHGPKIVSVPPGHGQFNPIPPNGAPLGAGSGVAGGPPGFGGYVVPPPLHPHHPHMSQTAASSTSHIPVQQGVVSSSLLTTPRGPVGYHDMRLGGNTWIPR